jgi:hypothetical protein
MTRRTRRGGRERSIEPSPEPRSSRPDNRYPNGVQPSRFPGGGFVSECECGAGWWRPTVPLLVAELETHARRRHPQAA